MRQAPALRIQLKTFSSCRERLSQYVMQSRLLKQCLQRMGEVRRGQVLGVWWCWVWLLRGRGGIVASSLRKRLNLPAKKRIDDLAPACFLHMCDSKFLLGFRVEGRNHLDILQGTPRSLRNPAGIDVCKELGRKTTVAIPVASRQVSYRPQTCSLVARTAKHISLKLWKL